MADRTMWYIDPCGDPVTNRLIAEQCPEEDVCMGKLCSDGQRRNLWRCDRSVVREMIRARAEFKMKFLLFVQAGKHGKVRAWNFEKSTDSRLKKRRDEQVLIHELEKEAHMLITSAE